LKKYLVIGALVCVLALAGAAWIYKNQSKAVSADLNTLTIEAKQDLDSDNFDGAINAALQAASNDISDVNALILLASAYAQKGSVQFQEKEYGQKALDTLAQAISIDPKNSEAYRVQGFAYEIMSMWPQATESYNKAIELNPKNAHAYANRGHMYDLLGNFANARADYTTAINIDPNEEHALFNLARLQARAEEYTQAKDLIAKALAISTSSGRKAEMYQVLATIELTNKNYTEATNDILKSISFNDKLPAAYVTRGEIARAELAEKIFKKEQIPDFQDRVNAIVNDAAKATSIYEGQTSAIVLVGKVLVLLAEYDQATKVFEKALTMIDSDISLGIIEKTNLRAQINDYIKIIADNANVK
jgi:tetratricopeptide (TPR) repeat protein